MSRRTSPELRKQVAEQRERDEDMRDSVRRAAAIELRVALEAIERTGRILASPQPSGARWQSERLVHGLFTLTKEALAALNPRQERRALAEVPASSTS